MEPEQKPLCHQLGRGDNGTEFFLECHQSLPFLIQDLKKTCGNIGFFSVSFFLKVQAGNDVVDIKGELFNIKIFRIFFINKILEQVFQIIIFGEKANGSQNGIHITVKASLQPAQPYFHVPLFTQQFFGLPAPGFMGQEIV